MHACETKEVQNKKKQLDIIYCILNQNKNFNFNDSKKCVENARQKWDLIKKCFMSTTGNDLIKEMWNQTKVIEDPLSFVPTIRINEVSQMCCISH